MARSLLERSHTLPYHVVARTNNREKFRLPMDQVWDILTKECLNLRILYGAEIHAFVLMPNHFHMLITTPEEDLGKLMLVFMSYVTRTCNLVSGHSGHVFGGPHHRTLIKSTRYFGHALKYVYRNPVKAQLCSKVEEYPYSTLHGLLGQSALPFPIHYTRVGMELNLPPFDDQKFLDWLNRSFPEEAEKLIANGLRKKVFDSIKDLKTRTFSKLLAELL